MRLPLPDRSLLLLGTGLLLLAVAARCGAGEPPTIGPGGVDGLVIPASLPLDPADYVTRPDGNRYLPLPDARLADVEGIAVARWEHGGVVDLVAEDAAGDLWWFGREGEWVAGEDGARPGLLLPARPRRGDGFQRALVPGLVDQSATVAAVGDGTLTLDVADPLDPAVAGREIYEVDRGLVSPADG